MRVTVFQGGIRTLKHLGNAFEILNNIDLGDFDISAKLDDPKFALIDFHDLINEFVDVLVKPL